MKKIAVIDLGTNTFNLIIANVNQNHFTTLFSDKVGVALGMGGINKKVLAEEAMDRAYETLNYFKSKCDEFKVDETRAFGTSAIRDAANKEYFCNEVLKRVGIKIHVISGDEEATLIYRGVKWSYNFNELAIIMDIGGGSTEFILADQNGIKTAISLNIGVSRMYQQLKLNDPLTPDDITTIEQWLEENAEGKLDHMQCDVLIGSSGTFETLHELYVKQKFPETIECISMDLNELNSVLDDIIQSTLAERQQNPFIIPIRQIMIPIASVKIQWILKKLGIKRLLISPCSLKEGALS